MNAETTAGDTGVGEGMASSEPSIQLRLSTAFMITFIAAALAAFLNPRGSDLLLAAAVTVVGGAALAFLVGSVCKPRMERVFWSVVTTAMMLAVAGNVTLLDRAGIYAWPIVAGIAATIAAGMGGRYQRMILAAALAGLTILPYVVWYCGSSAAVISYVICAAIGGALLTMLVEGVRWIESQYRFPQPAIGLVLVLAAIGFSAIAANIIPGW